MGFEPVVDVHPSYPGKQPFCALSEFINRYLPRYLPGFVKGDATDESKDWGINKKSGENTVFNKGFQQFHDYCREKNIDLLIYLHAERREWENNGYNEQGEEIIGFCLKNDIQLIKELDFRFPEDAYRDDIHLSLRGQRKMFEVLKDALPL
jgi:hypothetical protein